MQTIQEIFGFKEVKPFSKSKVEPVECAAPDQMVGVEIETEECPRGLAYYVDTLPDIWTVKTDGSLRGQAFEFITKPAAIKILIPELADFYAKTGFTDKRNYTDRCSIHVHTNVLDMTQQQLGTLCLVYSIVEDLLFQFVNYYAVENPEGAYRDTNIYCVPWNQCRMNHNIVSRMFDNPDFAFKSWQKYTALNLIPVRAIGTVEWRHMHGTANMEKLTKWLNLIGSIMNYSKRTDFEIVVKTIRELNDTSAYQRFFSDVLGDYLPYEQKYERALSAGVVNAKYAIIELKDTKPKPILKPLKKSIDELLEAGIAENVQEAPHGLAGAFRNPAVGNLFDIPLDPFMAQNAGQHAGAEVQGAAARLRAEAVRAPAALPRRGRNRGDAMVAGQAAPVNRAVQRPLPPYPYSRCTIRVNGLVRWGFEAGDGLLYDVDGQQLPLGAHVAVRTGEYCEGIAGKFWRTVPVNWRPAAAQEGEF